MKIRIHLCVSDVHLFTVNGNTENPVRPVNSISACEAGMKNATINMNMSNTGKVKTEMPEVLTV